MQSTCTAKADELRQVHRYLWVQVYKKEREQIINREMKRKIFTKSVFQTENEIKEPNRYSKRLEGRQVTLQINKQTNKKNWEVVQFNVQDYVNYVIKFTSENVASHGGFTSHYASKDVLPLQLGR